MTQDSQIAAWLEELPLVAILRGLRPDEAGEIGGALVECGFRFLEVPLNSPDPFTSIAHLASAFGDRALIGAGTVLTPEDCGRVTDRGGRLIVMPHGDAQVIQAAKRLGAYVLPGVATPKEAFAALHAGADGLKMFPAEILQPPVVKAWRAVLPRHVGLYPVGGITPANMAAFREAGASGFGLGSALYKPGMAPELVAQNARAMIEGWHNSLT